MYSKYRSLLTVMQNLDLLEHPRVVFIAVTIYKKIHLKKVDLDNEHDQV